MKKLSLLIIILVAFANTQAQTVWCPSGARWIFKSNGFGGESYNECKYDKDTLLNGVVCKKIVSRSGWSNFGQVSEDSVYMPFAFTFIRNDSVFYGNTDTDIKMIYIFGLQKADSFFYHYNLGTSSCRNDSTVNLIIDSVGTLKSYGLNLKFYDVHLTDSINNLSYGSTYPRIIERLGATFGLFRPSTYCYVDENYPMLCYYEDDSTVHDTIAYNQCRKLYSGINEAKLLLNNFSLYPNPSSGKTKITSLDNTEFALKLFDQTGRLLFSKAESTASIFDFSFLSDGFYFVNLSTPKGNITKRLIISR